MITLTRVRGKGLHRLHCYHPVTLSLLWASGRSLRVKLRCRREGGPTSAGSWRVRRLVTERTGHNVRKCRLSRSFRGAISMDVYAPGERLSRFRGAGIFPNASIRASPGGSGASWAEVEVWNGAIPP